MNKKRIPEDEHLYCDFLQCFDTVGLVIWPVKIVPDIAYNVFGGTLNLAQSITVTKCVHSVACTASD